MTKIYDMDIEEKFRHLLTKLQSYNVLTAEKHLCCSGCAMADLEPKAEKAQSIGFVYNHEQDYPECSCDEEYDNDESDEWGWGYFPGDCSCDMEVTELAIRYAGLSRDSKFIGDLIHIECINMGLDVKWDGNPDKVIYIK